MLLSRMRSRRNYLIGILVVALGWIALNWPYRTSRPIDDNPVQWFVGWPFNFLIYLYAPATGKGHVTMFIVGNLLLSVLIFFALILTCRFVFRPRKPTQLQAQAETKSTD
jgi:hypothetical protein